MAIKNDCLLKALALEKTSRTPIWIMRQAGRYLPEYRALRASLAGDFMDFCKNPELCAKATMLPIDRFDLDAAILFSDILTIADAMDVGLKFIEGRGPVIASPIRSASDIDKLKDIDPNSDLAYVDAAIKAIRRELAGSVPLIGFGGSPWTLATYLVEGEGSKNFNKIRSLMYSDPRALHKLLDYLARQLANALWAQAAAGVDVLMIFDSWGGVLSDQLFLEFSLHYMQAVVLSVRTQYPELPIVLFSKNGGRSLSQLAATKCALGIDWQADMRTVLQQLGDGVCIQGNLDPCCLFADDETLVAKVQELLQLVKGRAGYIFNLGHGILPETNPDKLELIIKTIRQGG